MQYLLERVGDFFGAMNVPKRDIRILLEAREQTYSSLLSFVAAIQKNPLDQRATKIRNIDRFSITTVKKRDDICMGLADFGSNAIFSAVRRDTRSFGLSETRYIAELAPVLLAGKTGLVVPSGIKPIHTIESLALPDDVSQFWKTLRNPKAEYHLLS
jgi:hypothetical protein